jgi:hypothetical protein
VFDEYLAMRRDFAVLLVAVWVAVSATSIAHADSFSLTLGGHGHHRHGHHHHYRYHDHCWGPTFGIGFYSPPPPRYVYVAPPVVQERIYVQPPVVQERVIIQQQQQPLASNTYDSSANTASAPRLPAPPTRTAAVGAPVIVRNTTGKGVPVAFLVDDRSEELRDGQTRTFSGSSHVIEFDRGGDLGTARYELTSGMYGFTITDRGWELVRETNTTPSARTADRPALRKNELPQDLKSR